MPLFKNNDEMLKHPPDHDSGDIKISKESLLEKFADQTKREIIRLGGVPSEYLRTLETDMLNSLCHFNCTCSNCEVTRKWIKRINKTINEPHS